MFYFHDPLDVSMRVVVVAKEVILNHLKLSSLYYSISKHWFVVCTGFSTPPRPMCVLAKRCLSSFFFSLEARAFDSKLEGS